MLSTYSKGQDRGIEKRCNTAGPSQPQNPYYHSHRNPVSLTHWQRTMFVLPHSRPHLLSLVHHTKLIRLSLRTKVTDGTWAHSPSFGCGPHAKAQAAEARGGGAVVHVCSCCSHVPPAIRVCSLHFLPHCPIYARPFAQERSCTPPCAW